MASIVQSHPKPRSAVSPKSEDLGPGLHRSFTFLQVFTLNFETSKIKYCIPEFVFIKCLNIQCLRNKIPRLYFVSKNFKEFQRFPEEIQLVGKQVATLSVESQKITAKISVGGSNLIKE